VRPHDGGPATDDGRRDVVGKPSEAARRTRPAGVARIDKADGDPGQRRLVGDEGAELPEGPAMQRGALRPRNPNPRADVRQVLQRDPSLRAFGRRHELLADPVVCIVSKASLFVPSLL